MKLFGFGNNWTTTWQVLNYLRGRSLLGMSTIECGAFHFWNRVVHVKFLVSQLGNVSYYLLFTLALFGCTVRELRFYIIFCGLENSDFMSFWFD